MASSVMEWVQCPLLWRDPPLAEDRFLLARDDTNLNVVEFQCVLRASHKQTRPIS